MVAGWTLKVRATSLTERPSWRSRDELLLIGPQLGRPAEGHAALPGGLAALVRPQPDELALELGDAGEDGQHHPARR